MARLSRSVAVLAAAISLAALAGGCGGGGDDAVPCDDAAFRDQSEQLYVAIATAQNALAPGAPPTVVADLRKGVGVLTAHLDAHPPCADDLQELADREREALGRLDTALTALQGGEDASGDLEAAVAALGSVEQALR